MLEVVGIREPSFGAAGMWTGPAAMDSSVLVPLKIKNRVFIAAAAPLPTVYMKTSKTCAGRVTCTLCSLQHYSLWPRLGDSQVPCDRARDREDEVRAQRNAARPEGRENTAVRDSMDGPGEGYT